MKSVRGFKDDPRSCALKNKLQKHHMRLCQFYDKILGEGLAAQKAVDPRRGSTPAKLASEKKQGLC